ncbi:MAG: hypothetical protein QW680_10745 [Pyrobaculum sp.]
MKITFVTVGCSLKIGSIQYVVYSIAQRLSKGDHDVYVLCGENKISSPREEIIDRVKITR